MESNSNLLTRQWLVAILGKGGLVPQELEADLDRYLKSTADLQLDELGLDSLATMQLALDIEEELGIIVGPELLASAHTLDELLDYLNSKTKETS